MRVAIASRIFEPEPSAASFRLQALAEAFADAGHETTVLTVRPSKQHRAAEHASEHRSYRAHRFPVLRDRTGYVRGYLQYLSFDVPLFFRVLLGPTRDALVVEPPPTTLFFAGLAARIRRIPVFAYAADVWSDASESAGAPSFVVKVVRGMERSGWNRALGVFSVNDGVTDRVRAIAPQAVVETVGNGIDTKIFRIDGPVFSAGDTSPYAIYTGTASEWQGAEVFVRAIAQLRHAGSPLRLVFLGQGTAFPALERLAEELDAPVEFHAPVPPEEAAAWLRGAAVSLASIQPGAGYDFAYPTKIFAAWGCGAPVVYAGPGPAREALEAHPMLGLGVEHDPGEVASALQQVVGAGPEAGAPLHDREGIAAWAGRHVSLSGVAARAVAFSRSRLDAGRNTR